jgi:hypothetical protein
MEHGLDVSHHLLGHVENVIKIHFDILIIRLILILIIIRVRLLGI